MTPPFRPCDHCDKPAVVHNTAIVNGVMHEAHLCEEHAQAVGIQLPASPAIGKLIAQFTVAAPARARGPVCARCGMTYAEHRQHGVLGCGDCYEAFGKTLSVVLERAHGCEAQHVGKAPPRVADAHQRTAMLKQLLQDLEEAVRAEQYERAARLRDQMKELRPGAGAPAAGECAVSAGSAGGANGAGGAGNAGGAGGAGDTGSSSSQGSSGAPR